MTLQYVYIWVGIPPESREDQRPDPRDQRPEKTVMPIKLYAAISQAKEKMLCSETDTKEEEWEAQYEEENTLDPSYISAQKESQYMTKEDGQTEVPDMDRENIPEEEGVCRL